MKDKDYHVITTSHPWFARIGLTSFTTGILAEWWNTKNKDGVYVNRKNVNKTTGIDNTFSGGSPELVNEYWTLLGLPTENGGDRTNEFYWYGWKPLSEKNSGRYLRQNLSGAGSDYGGVDSPSSEFAEGQTTGSWQYASEVGKLNMTTYRGGNIGDGLLDEETAPINGLKLADDAITLEYLTTLDKFESEGSRPMHESLAPIYDIIQLNRWMSAWEKYYPRETWDKDVPESIGGLSSKAEIFELWSRYELLTDIKSSKGGAPYLSWSGDITFFTSVNDGLIDNCEITEPVVFKLYLFDDETLPSVNKSIATTSTKFVGPRRDVLGKQFTNSEDGSWNASDNSPENAANQVAADLDVSLNPITKKWESGTPNLFAKMVADLPPMTNSPEVDLLLDLNLKDALAGLDDSKRFIPTSGLAMPIRIQNGNNVQWSPNYLEPEDVRNPCDGEETFKKETLTVYNLTRGRTFRKDEEVMLSRVDGKWIVSQLGIDISGEVPSDVDAKWGEFNYFMTNSEYWFKGFRKSDDNSIDYTPESVEILAHRYYYENDIVRSEISNTVAIGELGAATFPANKRANYGLAGGYDAFNGFRNDLAIDFYFEHAFLQTTSYDCLDRKILGTRGQEGRGQTDTCSISSTNPLISSAGKAVSQDITDFRVGFRNSALTHTFFGAIFPEGFAGTDAYFTDRDWQVRTTWEGYDTAEIVNRQYMSTDSAAVIKKDQLPFSVEDTAGFDAGTGSNRNGCRRTYESDPLTIDQDRKIKPSRLDPNPAPSLFYEATVANNFSLRHLPADVALNASPETGRFGSPIRPLQRMRDFCSEYATTSQGQATMWETHVKAHATALWARKEDQDIQQGQEPVYSKQDSAFDFQPRANRVMFRPCKMEFYNQFGTKKRDVILDQSDNRSPLNPSTNIKNNRQGFEVEANRYLFDSHRPASTVVENREDYLLYPLGFFNPIWGMNYVTMVGNDFRRGYADKLNFTGYWSSNAVIGTDFGDSANGAFQWLLGEGYEGIGEADHGSNAFGVISTYFNGYKATEEIQVTTTNRYGVGPSALESNNQTGNIQREVYHGWGTDKPFDLWKRENIMSLNMRVYHNHPANQIIYDSRCFAVHHYNPDPRFVNDKLDGISNIPAFTEGIETTEDLTGTYPRNCGVTQQTGTDANGDLLTWFYYAPIPSSTVDRKEPSRYQNHIDPGIGSLHTQDAKYFSRALPSGSYVMKDATMDGTTLQPPLMDENFWQINTLRVGQMLPFNWLTYNQGIPVATPNWKDQVFSIVGDAGIDSNTFPETTSDDKFFAKDVGGKIIYNSDNREVGFVAGDIIGDSGRLLQLEVVAATDTGEITQLRYQNPGVGITESLSSGTLMTKGDTGPIKLGVIQSTNGTNLNLSYAMNQIWIGKYTDPKPIKVLREGESIINISAGKIVPNFPNESFQDLSTANSESMVQDEEVESTIVLDQNNLSENGAYDLFFQFHNDCSMAWEAGGVRFFGANSNDNVSSNGYHMIDPYIQLTFTNN